MLHVAHGYLCFECHFFCVVDAGTWKHRAKMKGNNDPLGRPSLIVY